MGCARVGAYCIRPLDVSGRRRLIDTENGPFFLAFRIFFSSLDGRKEAKEDQGLTEAGEVGRIHDRSKKVPGKTSLSRQGPFLPSREEKKIIARSKTCRPLGCRGVLHTPSRRFRQETNFRIALKCISPLNRSPPCGAVQGPYAIRPYIRVPVKKTPPKFIAMNH